MIGETNTNEQKRTETINLTDRQLQMLAMAAIGMTNRAIGNKLGLAISTVANTLRWTYWKIGRAQGKQPGVVNRVLAVRWLIEQYGEV